METHELRSLLPSEAFVFVEAEKRIGIVKLFETGYYPTKADTSRMEPATVRAEVQRMNREAGVSPAQAAAMAEGSLWGWHVKTADPRVYESLPYSKMLPLY